MQLFLDTADIQEIRDRWDTGLISGITTNPTLVRKSGADYHELIQQIHTEFPGLESISAEVNGNTCDEMLIDAKTYYTIAPNVTIKLPLNPEGLKACKTLTDLGIDTNVTLCFSVAQAIMAALAGATYISPFVGRLNDNSFSGVELVKAIASLYRLKGVETKVLAASLREVHHVSRCFAYGADVGTLPCKVFDKMYDHVLTREGLELFNNDYLAAKKET